MDNIRVIAIQRPNLGIRRLMVSAQEDVTHEPASSYEPR